MSLYLSRTKLQLETVVILNSPLTRQLNWIATQLQLFNLFVKLAGGKQLTHLDLSQVYLQLIPDDESKDYVVINSH